VKLKISINLLRSIILRIIYCIYRTGVHLRAP